VRKTRRPGEEEKILDRGEKMEGKIHLRNLLTISQLAEQLQLSVGTIYYWVHRREIPVIRVGKHLRFDLSAVIEHFKDLTRLKERSPGLDLRKVVDEKHDRSLTTRDPDYAEFRGKE
jgi:excisionase family DNA binding protein